jgi:hypothetical protein
MLQRQYGGQIRVIEAKTESSRRQFHYELRAHQCKPLLANLKDRLFLKHQRALVALQILEMQSINDDTQGKIRELRDLQKQLDDVDVAFATLSMTTEYIAGLFDAEGCLSSGEKGKYIRSQLSITQRSNNKILEVLNCVLGYGTVANGRFMVYAAEDILKFIRAVGPHAVVKAIQLQAYIQMMETSELGHKKVFMKTICDAKHCEWDVNEDTLAKANAVGHILSNNMSKIFKDKTNEVTLWQVNNVTADFCF